MRAVCAWLDEGGRLAWLETDKERNVRFYSALGLRGRRYRHRPRRRDVVHAPGPPVVTPVTRPSRRRDLRAVPPLLRRPAAGELRGGRGRAPCGAWCSRCCRCWRPGPPTSAWPPTTSSSRSATTCGPATRPARVSTSCSWPSSPSSKPPSWPWAWWCGPWWSSKPTTRWRRRRRWPPTTAASTQVLVCTPDKDLAQCVRGSRVVQLDRRKDVITDEDAVRARYGIGPRSIPDWLALVGDSADGFPGLLGLGQAVGVDRARALRAPRGHPRRRLGLGPRAAAARCAVRPSSPIDWRRTWTTPCCSATWRRCAWTARCWRRWTTCEWKGPGADFEDMARFLRDPALADRAARPGVASLVGHRA